jgi:hypothetical protein
MVVTVVEGKMTKIVIMKTGLSERERSMISI